MILSNFKTFPSYPILENDDTIRSSNRNKDTNTKNNNNILLDIVLQQ